MEERYIELAEKNVEDEREFGLSEVRSQLVAEYHEDFDGENCLDCGGEIPGERLKDGKIRCTRCQTIRENKIKRGIWVQPNQVKPPERPAYMDTVVTEIRQHEATAAKNELTRVVEQLARNVNEKAERAAAIAMANRPQQKTAGAKKAAVKKAGSKDPAKPARDSTGET